MIYEVRTFLRVQVLQEYQILVDHSLHPNIPNLFGAFRYSCNSQPLRVTSV